MEQNLFYQHVSSWIDSYYNADALCWMRRFISNSNQPEEVKERLQREVDRKLATLNNTPYFGEHDGMKLLTDRQGYPEVFTTRYEAMGKLVQLRLVGYDVRLLEGKAFYRIQLVQPAPVDFAVLAEENLRMSA